MESKDQFSKKPSEGEFWDVAIIGSGPSGLTAAIYTTRGAASTILFAGDMWGGQLMLTTTVDNFPGFPEGIEGPELMSKMRKQAERFGCEIINSNAESIKKTDLGFEVVSSGKTYKTKSIIIATGAETKWLGTPGEEKLRGRGVSSCAPCDAPFFKDKKVAVIGGGDSAMEEALVLSKYASAVTLIHRRDEFKASAAMIARVDANSKITKMFNSEVVEFIGDTKLDLLKIKNVVSGEISDVQFDGAFVAIGHTPSTSIFNGLVELDEKGYIKKNSNFKLQMTNGGTQMSTSVDGIFVAGDVHDYHYKQAITAAGFGCMAGMEALHYLDKSVPNW